MSGLLSGLLLAACSTEPAPDAGGTGEQAPPPSNRIAVPQLVRDNLGIRFATVERRRVAATIRLPGQFELLPAAQIEYSAMLAGRVTIHVAPLEHVEKGALLATLDAPDWRRQQREIADLNAAIALDQVRIEAMKPRIEAHEAHERSIQSAIELSERRLAELETMRRDVGGQAAAIASTNVTLAQLRASAAESAEQHAETMSRLLQLRASVQSNGERLDLALATAASFTGRSTATLKSNWRTTPMIEFRATGPGIVTEIRAANGRFVATGAHLLTVTNPSLLRFRAHAPQSDLARLPSTATGRIVAPSGDGKPVSGTITIGVSIDERTRMAEVFLTANPAPTWTRPGLASFLEVETDASAPRAIAIPRRAVQRDGLARVIFRRDTKDPNKVVRVEAEFGAEDGEWIAVLTDLTDGDEVVVEGAYELMLESSGSTPKGGHFHADGTWHADGDH